MSISLQNSPQIVFVTDRTRYGADERAAREGLVAAAAAAAKAGVDLIQIRENGLEARELLNLTRDILAAVNPSGTKVVVNGRADVALAARADGVHLRSSSPPAGRVREIVGPDFVIGRSVHAVDEAVETERGGGCDYLLFGTVFPSVSKGPAHQAVGVDTLAEVCRSVTIPVLAIGGITLQRVGDVAAAGAAGVAAIDLFASAWTRSASAEPQGFRGLVEGIRAAFRSAVRSDAPGQ